MQTALALRDVVMTVADMVVYVLVYFITSGVILSSFDAWLIVPFICWMIGFAMIMRFLIPKLGRTAARQADARSLMTGRITDAYSNIATVKLFSHGAREAAYAKQSMEEFMVTVHAQMRLATLLHTCSFIVNSSLTVRHDRLGYLALVSRPSRRRRGSYGHGHGIACERFVAIHHVGVCPIV